MAIILKKKDNSQSQDCGRFRRLDFSVVGTLVDRGLLLLFGQARQNNSEKWSMENI